MKNKNILFCTNILFLIVFLFSSNANAQTVSEIRNQCVSFLNTIEEEQLENIQFDFNDSLRKEWSNLPIGLQPRPGIKYGELSAESKIQFHRILTTIFSSQGYLKTTSIMQLDDILNQIIAYENENGKLSDRVYKRLRDLEWAYENYFISVWGKPSGENPWGLKFGGHHLSVNLTVTGDEFSLTPLFIGTDPAEIKDTKYAGIRVLSKEEDYGFKLINSLNKKQQSIATLNRNVPRDIITNPNSDQRLTEYWGIKAGQLTSYQQEVLILLIKEFIKNLEHEKSTKYLNKLKQTGIDKIYFAWIGSYIPGESHYYIIHSPDFIIEYDNKSGNHIHAIWREKSNDFGEDILRSHYLQHKH